MENPLISVIMPVYNAAGFLPLTLSSVQAQTYSNWELIAVNDHSTDHSYAMLQYYAENDRRIRVFQNPGQGIISALQHGYRNSGGTYITRMDADDLMPPVKLMQLMIALSTNPTNRVSTGLVKAFSIPGPCGKGFARYAARLNHFLQSSNPWQFVYADCIIPSPCWMMHQTTFEQIGAFDGEQYPEDYDLCFRMYAAGCNIIVIPSVLHLWRDHSMRVSRTGAVYTEPEFFELKIRNFMHLDYDASVPLAIFGTGPKGKKLVRTLQRIWPGIPFYWISNTASKWGHFIYGVKVQAPDVMNTLPRALVLMVSSDRTANLMAFHTRWKQHRCWLFC